MYNRVYLGAIVRNSVIYYIGTIFPYSLLTSTTVTNGLGFGVRGDPEDPEV